MHKKSSRRSNSSLHDAGSSTVGKISARDLMGMSEAKGRKMGGSGGGRGGGVGGGGGDVARRMGARRRATLAMQIQQSMLL